ncbi:unnamed protein product [Prorocentrum cordatum]|uniref:Uncharacterized protein n=1 Tax=Prorocentrum cordatum TaxID=2364126 RepID=A0ABN9WDV7_9DINO|nr:unnamed protein product [Polarella glacialis]
MGRCFRKESRSALLLSPNIGFPLESVRVEVAAAQMSQNPVTRLYGPKTTRASDSLFERMGGDKKLDEVVTAVYNDMKNDKEIGKFFARFRLERLKDRTVDYLRGEWGGESYKGSDLWTGRDFSLAHGHQLSLVRHHDEVLCPASQEGAYWQGGAARDLGVIGKDEKAYSRSWREGASSSKICT